ncbi:2-succinylbenzoate--CoA ligase [Ancylothrix sp. C2]|uniref:2-succinylbenzoate--CoA ligase n=1 Tax=Ancylothrix sp. D3o TaxID=2953691 RepID=UPI0021BB2412|nr:2-succinylbenzoate--CoA ligase [Ancylothrix sp. D3o]MCT7948774.1 2-succinylbenzoate--CoA ligase [Ancylothrix sp. D3o]
MIKQENIIEHLGGLPADWLSGYDNRQLLLQVDKCIADLKSIGEKSPKVILAENDPVGFISVFFAAVSCGYPVFLANPNSAEKEWQEVLDLVQPDLIFKENLTHINKNTAKDSLKLPIENFIMIPTGGSSGKLRFAIHTWETLMASVQGFSTYFAVEFVNSCCVLPVYHVSGLMQLLRCFATGGKLAILPFKDLENNLINPENYFISLVPTQLHRLLQTPNLATWLSKFSTVLLGGAPAWSELLEIAKKQQIRLALTYGMTETASQIVTLKPDDFLAGNTSCGKVLPHATVKIVNDSGETLPPNQIGNIIITADSLLSGYYPGEAEAKQNFKSDDLGYFDDEGYLYVVGRSSDKIISGGENVFPAEIEAAILATHCVKDVCVVGIPDKDWGEVVTAVYVPESDISQEELQTALVGKLSKYKLPKYWVPVEVLPRNLQGKINRQEVLKIALPVLQNSISN